MVAEKRDLLFRFIGDARSLQRSSRFARTSLGRLEGSTMASGAAFAQTAKMVGGFAAVVGAAGAVKAVTSSITAASDLTETINAVEVSYGDAADAVLGMNETSAESFGLSSRAMNEAAVTMAGFVKQVDEADPASKFQDLLQRATDFASVMNIDVEEALDRFRSGLAGQSRPLQRFGIDLTDASVQAFALRTGIKEAGQEMTNQEKIQARYGLLMERTAIVAGDFANTSDELANRQRILASEFEDLQAEIGSKLLPTAKAMVGSLMNLLDATGANTDQANKYALALEGLAEMLELVTVLIAALSTENQKALEADHPLLGFLGNLKTALGRALPTHVLSEVVNQLGNIGTVLGDTEAALASADQALVNSADRWTDYAPTVNEATVAWIGGVGVLRDQLNPALVEMILESEQAAETTEELRGETDRAKGTMEDYATAVAELADPVIRAERAHDDFIEKLEEMQSAAEPTEEQILEVVEAFIAAQSTANALNPANIASFMETVEEATGLSREELQKFFDGLNVLNGQTISGKLSPVINLTLEIDLDATEKKIADTIKGLQSQGIIQNIFT